MGKNWAGVGSVYLLVGLILGALRSCNGGISSIYARTNGISADMPLNSDVFALPPGYNAPQQVINTLIIHVYVCIYIYICSQMKDLGDRSKFSN